MTSLRQDIRAHGFWSAGQDAFFDIRVFHPNASSNRSTTTAAAYRKHETAKKREYAQRIREVEHGVFTPLVSQPPEGWVGRQPPFTKGLQTRSRAKKEKPFQL